MGEPVASEPRLFVGQIPQSAREEDLFPLFTPYGNVRNLHLLRGSDGKPRGCAMVLFSRWAEAEAACSLDGSVVLESGGQSKPLVVHFANPRRAPPGQPAEPGIAPRKLFVGQVPRDVTEEQLRPLFEPYGDIEHINILRTHRGQSAGCAFVQFAKWSQAEAAMEAHNSKTRLGTSEVPLVVKFADAKRKDPTPHHMQMHGGWMGGPLGPRHLDAYSNALGNGLGLGGMGGMGGYQHLGGDMLNDHSLLNNMGLIGNGGPYGGQDPNLLGNPLLTGNLANSLADSLGLTQGLAAVPPSQSLPTGLPNGLPGNGALGFNMGLPNGGGRHHIDSLSASFGKMGLGPRSAMPARPWGQRIGSNDKHNEWKLFIGQVPLEASEEELFSLFSPIGEILELYILRNSNGKSRGCAFVTYANKYLAQQAITQLNGKQVPPGKTLVVKFADRASAGRATQRADVSAGYQQPQVVQANGNGNYAYM
ncbi:hypothetical protein CVIRNUC_007310 [Coccomyxa viridis]|uniref:RRM domain-containing protein n=1 Tax=Coccomyxa viridis TaxID=1274662 RepID=A0AAV1ID05_9CHLO|nr:hypothetical protein CVIRNUC_007310 [Coccomyxa viridis]